MKYRIIEQTNNLGEVSFSPQVNFGGWGWREIIKDRDLGYYYAAKHPLKLFWWLPKKESNTYSVGTFEIAKDHIEKYKEDLEYKRQHEVKSSKIFDV